MCSVISVCRLTVQDSCRKNLLGPFRGQSDDGRDDCPRAHAEHAPSASPVLAHEAADNNTSTEADIVQTVEKRQPVWFELIFAEVFVIFAKALDEAIHRLDCRVASIVETVVEGRDSDDYKGQGQLTSEMPNDARLRHFGLSY